MARLFSYVVDHDYGYAPNPEVNYCTLVHCKFRKHRGKKNIVESASVGDWVLGAGGNSSESAGQGNLIYFMRVDEILPFHEFLQDPRFHTMADCKDHYEGNSFALISKEYYYYGKKAWPISELPADLRDKLLKKGPSYRRDYPEDKLELLIKWFRKNKEIGQHGKPCVSSDPDLISACD